MAEITQIIFIWDVNITNKITCVMELNSREQLIIWIEHECQNVLNDLTLCQLCITVRAQEITVCGVNQAKWTFLSVVSNSLNALIIYSL